MDGVAVTNKVTIRFRISIFQPENFQTFDFHNIRYMTATHIGTWAMDKLIRFCLLTRDGEPIMWDFGSAARHHKLYNPWLGEERSRAGISTLRGSVKGRAESVAEKLRVRGRRIML